MYVHSLLLFDIIINMKLLLEVFILSMIPIGECRVSIPYGIYNGLSIAEVILTSFLGNSLMGILIYRSIDFISNILLHKEPFKKYYEEFIRNKLKRLKIYSLGIVFSILVFISIPLPGTGAFTGAILARILGLSFKQASIAITFGVFFASIMVTVITLSSKIIF